MNTVTMATINPRMDSGQAGDRITDPFLSPVLYRLSYWGLEKKRGENIVRSRENIGKLHLLLFLKCLRTTTFSEQAKYLNKICIYE